MSTVNTLRGPVDSSQIGTTLMHEHLMVRNPELERNIEHPEYDEAAIFARARASLTSLHVDKGIDTFVDLTVLGLGRDIPTVLRLTEDVPLNIVVATGYYTAKDLPTYFHTHAPDGFVGRTLDGPDVLERMFVDDVVKGVPRTDGVRAGIIKIVTDEHGITPDLDRVYRAAARAQAETGVPISTHTNVSYANGRDQQKWFVDNGVDLGRTIIGHSGDSTDLGYLKELMDNGSFIGMDRFGMEFVLDDESRIDTLVKLIEQGYTERITISHDAGFFSINTPTSWRAKHTPNWHHHRISDHVLPELRKRGVTEDQITQIMVVNPVQALTGDVEATRAVAEKVLGTGRS
ncbi:phosphotriesterase family protein [Pseudonocardia abyssalis]|uniref:Phosphotriesterase n=1 Tax=Pseudonocardia abyssalis TaxID=2792008 RepID=A0ABS6UNU4_9PSEU|nr:phosphotriesterase-related protein [Pseudonocardia abyssalis]MBW0116293.1 phosphotriesterase [Pseudonocardia abyssalis]MBW0133847.1 phosphotriesterase [Pseudonocardia abyssalis]